MLAIVTWRLDRQSRYTASPSAPATARRARRGTWPVIHTIRRIIQYCNGGALLSAAVDRMGGRRSARGSSTAHPGRASLRDGKILDGGHLRTLMPIALGGARGAWM